jgi:hypothetical protein
MKKMTVMTRDAVVEPEEHANVLKLQQKCQLSAVCRFTCMAEPNFFLLQAFLAFVSDDFEA